MKLRLKTRWVESNELMFIGLEMCKRAGPYLIKYAQTLSAQL